MFSQAETASKIISFYLDKIVEKLVSKGVLTESEAGKIQDETRKYAETLTHKEIVLDRLINSITDDTSAEEILDKAKTFIKEQEEQ